MPPFFGVSSTGAAKDAPIRRAPRPAARVADLASIGIPPNNASCSSSPLFIEPDRRQILVDVMARADFPALYIRSVGNDAIPPQYPNLVGLCIEHIFLEIAHQSALLGEFGLAQHLVVEINLHRAFIVAILCAVAQTL